MATMELVAMVVLMTVVSGLILWPLLARGSAGKARSAGAGIAAPASETRRRAALSAIKELEFDFATGKIAEDDYAMLRRRYEARALEALSAPPTPPAESGDEQLEAEIRAARGRRYCASCGAALPPAARFCPNCGTAAHPRPEAEDRRVRGGTSMRLLRVAAIVLLAGTPLLAASPSTWTISGTVTNHTGRPRAVAGQEVTLTVYVNGAEADWKTARTGARGEFSFAVPGDPDRTYAVQVKYKGGEYDSPPIVFKPGESVRRVAMRIYEPTSDPRVLRVNVHHIIVEAGEGVVQVAELLVFSNTGDRTYIGGAPRADGKRETLRITLPAGAANVQFMEGLMECCVSATDTGLVDTMDVEPGMRQIAYAYTVQIAQGRLALRRRLDYPTDRVEVFGRAGFGMEAPGLQRQDDVQTDQGTYARFSTANAAAGSEIRIAASGLPVPRSGLRRLAIAAFAGIVAAALAYPLLRRRRREGSIPTSIRDRDDTRQGLIAAVAALDDRFEAGEIPEQEYRERRARYIEKLRRMPAA